MLNNSFKVHIFLLIALLASVSAIAQSADNTTPLFSRGDEKRDQPKNVREMLQKLRIEREIKDYNEMLDRGDTALKLSLEIEQSYAERGQLTDTDQDKLQTIEKTVRKIRSELGGDDNDENISEILGPAGGENVATAVSILKATTTELCEELKKTTRFSISAAAIESSNSAIKIARFLLARK